MGELFYPDDMTRGEIGIIGADNIKVFGPLLTMDVRKKICNKEPVLAIGWQVDNIATGALAGQIYGETFELESLYVSPAFRNSGGGTFLLDTLEKLADGYASLVKFDLVVTDGEHELLSDFLVHRGFFEEDDPVGTMWYTTLGEAADSRFFKKTPGDKPLGKSFDETGRLILQSVERDCELNNEPLPEGGLLGGKTDSQISRFYGDDKDYAFVAVSRGRDGAVILSAVVNKSGKPQILPFILKEALQSALELAGRDVPLYIPVVSEVSEGLVRSMLPGARRIDHNLRKEIA